MQFQARQTLRDATPSFVENSNPEASTSTHAPTSITLEERVAKAKQLLAERQAQKAREEEEVRGSALEYFIADSSSLSQFYVQ